MADADESREPREPSSGTIRFHFGGSQPTRDAGMLGIPPFLSQQMKGNETKIQTRCLSFFSFSFFAHIQKSVPDRSRQGEILRPEDSRDSRRFWNPESRRFVDGAVQHPAHGPHALGHRPLWQSKQSRFKSPLT